MKAIQAKQLKREKTSIPLKKAAGDLAFSNDTSSHNAFQKKRKVKLFHPVVLSSIAALLIGTVLGLMVIQFFIGSDNTYDLWGSQSTVPKATTGASPSATEQPQTIQLEAMQAYVLQAGVFSEKENADQIAAQFQKAGVHTMVWNRDDQYYLFADAAGTLEAANSKAEKLKAMQLDVYVKEWIVPSKTLEISTDSYEWVRDFQAQWEASLSTLDQDKNVASEGWKKLKETGSALSLADSKWQQLFDQVVPDWQQFIGNAATIHLLELWKTYEHNL